MSNSSARNAIRLRGVRHNNLKNFDLDLPLNQLIVITGLSGSGKSSLAFDTLFAEGQRRYIETFSPYARQFFDRMDKPRVDSIEGIPPAIAIEQRNAVKTTRSTVGTMTELCDYMKLLWPHIAQLHCRQCGEIVRKDSPQDIWKSIQHSENETEKPERLITFDVPLSEKISLEESLALVSKQGYQRLLVNAEIVRLDDLKTQNSKLKNQNHSLTVIQDRVKAIPANRARFVEACEQAYHFGKGKLAIQELADKSENAKSEIRNPKLFSNRFHCAACDIEYREPTPALFSFNHPVGACPTCRGFGRVISIDYNLVMPDRSKTLAECVVKPWLTGTGAESQRDLMRMCRHFEIPTNVPFEKLPKKWQDFVIEGEPDYGTDDEHEWPRAWYGVKGYFRWLESKAYKMHVRVLLSRYRAYTPCPDCHGARFQPEALLYKFTIDDLRLTNATPEKTDGSDESASIANRKSQITLADFYQLPIRDALKLIDAAMNSRKSRNASRNDPIDLAFGEVLSRLGFLNEVGLGYLTLDRPTRSLSGGETERVNLTTCLGTRLVNTLFVLDEPSVGLHPRDTERLVRILQQLRNAGNTVVVVEHEASVMRAANQIVDIGPGHGATGGEIVFQGTFPEILKSQNSLTGKYLNGKKEIEVSRRRPVKTSQSQKSIPIYISSPENSEAFALNDSPLNSDATPDGPMLKIKHATRNNLQNVSVEIPLGRFVCITGVSGSGKSTLVREVLLPALETNLKSRISNSKFPVKASERIENESDSDDERENPETQNAKLETTLTGFDSLNRVVLVDQSILGKTPRSNPAVYIGAFDDIREVFTQSESAKQHGFNASAFSFNSAQGQCERCRGAGFEKIEMQFLSDVFIRCPDCDGRRYRPHILEIKISSSESGVSSSPQRGANKNPKSEIRNPKLKWSIADMLEATVDEAIEFLSGFSDSRPARRSMESLKLLQEVGLGYLKLGQPINTLSGGESQRLKLVKHLAEATCFRHLAENPERDCRQDVGSTLFLFDEPTTGLHFDDVRVLLKVFQRLVDAGHSVLVIEHNLDVIKSADWIIDLGPDAGDEGGKIIAEGTPEKISECAESHTGRALKTVLNQNSTQPTHEKNSRNRLARGRSRFAR